jgi:hypothetical protein
VNWRVSRGCATGLSRTCFGGRGVYSGSAAGRKYPCGARQRDGAETSFDALPLDGTLPSGAMLKVYGRQ